MQPRIRRSVVWLAFALAITLGVTACGSSAKRSAPASSSNGAGGGDVTLRLGLFANVTHAPALIGVESGSIQARLGDGVRLETKTFNAGSEVVTALLAGALDASFVGPNPAINAYQKTNGEVRVVSGVASGGAYLVVKPGIASAAQLEGKKIATPQLGNTQDVALRTWLNRNGLHETKDGGDVTILPQENSVTLTSFQQGSIDGAWVPEPWATRLVEDGGGKVLVDEKTLWPSGQYTTTVLLVTKKFLDDHPGVVQHLIEATSDAVDLTRSDPAQAQRLTNQGIQKITGKALSDQVIASSFAHITFTLDPIASSLQTSADNAKALGFLKSSDLGNLFDLSLVNKVLQAKHQPTVQH